MHPPSSDRSDESLRAEELAETCSMSPDEPAVELVRVLDEYLADLNAGRQPDRNKLLAEHPELASQLEQCFAGLEFIHRAATPTTGVPQQLGDFRIVREIGRGGMGVVYEAEQISLKRRIALKVLRYGAASDKEAMQRFQREAETVAGLHHTNIVPIFAIGSEQGVNYYAMQFIEGRSLSERQGLRSKGQESLATALPPSLRPQPSAVANWGLQAAEALAHAHQRGVVHRDVKPSNLILDPDGRLWLTDFGLAKRLDDVTLSLAGTILGTPRYMSPEQASSVKHPVDHRTDIYSLGATLYELVTGRPVFDADTAHGVITQILTAAPPAPRLVRPDVPRDFETIILKCLAKEPNRRYATAQALADDLRAFVEGRAIKARRATLAEQAARWFKQQKRSVGIAAATVAATIFVVVGSLIAWQMREQSRLGYLTLNTPRDGDQRAEVAEVLTLDDQPVGPPFTLPTKEPLALPEGAYRLRLTAPSKVSQDYLFDITAGQSAKFDVGLVNETVGYALPLRSPVGMEVVQSSRHAPRDEPSGARDRTPQGAIKNPTTKAPQAEREGDFEPRLFIGPQDQSQPTLRCYSRNPQPGWNPDGSRGSEVAPLWEANWSLEAPDIISFVKLPADREAWKVLPAQWDVAAWQQVLAWFDPWWFRNGTPPKLLQPACDLNGDGIEDVIWSAPQLANRQQGSFGPGPLTPKAAMLVAASGKDGKPLWWFRPQDSNGAASWLMTAPAWAGDDVLVCVLRSTNGPETWLEAVSTKSGEPLWRSPVPHAAGTTQQSLLYSAVLESVWPPDGDANSKPFVVAAVGRMLVAVDVPTGQPSWTPHDLGEGLQNLPRFADLDGDSRPEVLSISLAGGDQSQLTATSLAEHQPLWTARLAFNRVEPQTYWPLVVDLDDDNRKEVVLPNDSYDPKKHILGNGVQVLDGRTGQPNWSRRFPRSHYRPDILRPLSERFLAGPDIDGDGQRELFMTSIRNEFGPRLASQTASHHYEEYVLYVDCFSGRDGSSIWWQRIPLDFAEYDALTGIVGEPLWWGRDEYGWPKLVLAVHRHPDTQADGGTHSLYVLSAATGRIEHQADDLAFPQLVDWNNDGLDDLSVFVPDDPSRFANRHYHPDTPTGKFVVLRGSPPEAFRRLDRWVEEQDFDGDGIAELSRPIGGMGIDYAVQIASGRDGLIKSRWKVDWPETPRTHTVGDLHSFPPPLGDFDGDGLADLLLTRDSHFWDFESNSNELVKTGAAPLLMQALSGKSGRRIWGGPKFPLPDALRHTSADEKSESWQMLRDSQIRQVLIEAVDVDGDARPELLQSLGLFGYRIPNTGGNTRVEHQQQYVALTDGRDGSLRWAQPLTEFVQGNSWRYAAEQLQFDAAHDLNGDGTRDIVIVVPHRDAQGRWSGELQARNGRDGELLWPARETGGKWIDARGLKSPQISDLDGDGRPEIVLLETIQPQLHALRGDTGETLWTWKASQNLSQMVPTVALVQSSPVTPGRESRTSRDVDSANDTETTKDTSSASGNSSRGARGPRCVAVTINETGNQWELVLLDHTGQVVERVPYGSNLLWSHDLDGDGGEELLRYVDNKLTASRGLHEVLWTWSQPPSDYGWVSRFERSAEGRVVVINASGDSLTLLDGPTGKPLGRSFKSTNTSLQDDNRLVDLNRAVVAKPFENSRLLTRVGDGTPMLEHVVSRAVLPTDENGRYPPSRLSLRESTPFRAAKGDDDPRLVRRLMWAPTPAEWAAQRGQILRQVLLAVGLSFVIVLIPYWLIRAGVHSRELGWWRGALIFAGAALVLASLAVFRFAPPGAIWRDVPFLLPAAMAVGGLPILLYPAAMLGSLATGNWRRARWLIFGTLTLSAILAAIQMSVDLSRKPPEQHYSWFGWWMIFAMGAYFTGGCLLLGHVFGPGAIWLWKLGRRRFARHA